MAIRPFSSPRSRIYLLYPLIAVVVGVFTWRLYQLQVVDGAHFRQLADENRYRRVSAPAPRGILYDRNGIDLVRNVPSFNVNIVPAYLPEAVEYEFNPDGSFRTIAFGARTRAILDQVAEWTGVPFDTPPGQVDALGRPLHGLAELVAQQDTYAPYRPVTVKRDVPRAVAMIIRERLAELPGVEVEVVPLRNYPTGALTAHVVGYLGPIAEAEQQRYRDQGFQPERDKVGYAGIEYSQQELLAGRNGQKLVEVDVAGQQIRTVGEPTLPVPGYNLRLTIDVRLQAIAEAALRDRIGRLNAFLGRTQATNGVVIAMNPQTGEILAMVSWPAFDNNGFTYLGMGNVDLANAIAAVEYFETLIADPTNPLYNNAISGFYPPGSVYKMATAVGALQEGVITPEQLINDPGKIVIQDRYYPNDPGRAREYVCWLESGHGLMDFIQAVAQSCDVYFYKIGGGYEGDVADGGLGVDRMERYAHALGYGNLSGIELPGELAGLVPSRDWKRITWGENWATGDTYIATIGQGYVAATPLQVLNSIATLANGGRLMQPTLIREVLDGEGNVVRPFEPRVIWDLTQEGADIDGDGIADIRLDAEVIELAQRGMREVVVSGTASEHASLDDEGILSGGKTGTAEYCDDRAQAANRCQPGQWPTHSWYVGYAPYDAPEIAVVAFVYNGGEGAFTAGPIVQHVLRGYFELRQIDRERETNLP